MLFLLSGDKDPTDGIPMPRMDLVRGSKIAASNNIRVDKNTTRTAGKSKSNQRFQTVLTRKKSSMRFRVTALLRPRRNEDNNSHMVGSVVTPSGTSTLRGQKQSLRTTMRTTGTTTPVVGYSDYTGAFGKTVTPPKERNQFEDEDQCPQQYSCCCYNHY